MLKSWLDKSQKQNQKDSVEVFKNPSRGDVEAEPGISNLDKNIEIISLEGEQSQLAHIESAQEYVSRNESSLLHSKKRKRQNPPTSTFLSEKPFKDWIISIKDSTTKIKCKYCSCIINSKKSSLKDHSLAKKHIEASEPFYNIKHQKINFEYQTSNNKVKMAEARIALLVAKHTSTNVVDHITSTIKSSLTDSNTAKNVKLARTKCSAIIKNVWYPYFVKDLIFDIDQGFYSLLIDESTDVACLKYIGIVIIYYSKKRNLLTTTFLKLQEIETCDASSIADAIKAVLSEYNLPLNKMVGIGTDNAAVMVGINSGVYARLKSEVPRLILIPCVCHSLQLAVSEAWKNCLPRNLEYLVNETFSWFSHSSKRQIVYKNIFCAINDGQLPLKLTMISQTRWLSIETSVRRILDQWIELKTHFGIVRLSEKCYTAEILNEMFNDDANHAYFLFLRPVLSEVQRVNKAFESGSADLTKMLDDIWLLLSSILNKIITRRPNFDYMSSSIADNLMPLPYLGYEFEEKISEMKAKKSLSAVQEENIRKRCVDFLINLAKSVRVRLPQNIEILRKVKMLSVSQALRVIKEPLIPLLQEMKIKSDLITKIQNQWENLTIINWSEENKLDSLRFWTEVLCFEDSNGDSPYKELAEFAWSLLVLPLSNAEVERVFSVMNLVKNKTRNRLQTKMLNAIITARAGLKRLEKCCHNIDISPSMVAAIGSLKIYIDEKVINDECEAFEIVSSDMFD